jgi:octaprenyl-diphosphate synthase
VELIDSHAHLDSSRFDSDREAMLARARETGVAAIAAIGSASGIDRLEAALPFAEAHDWIWATIGIHPDEAHEAGQEHYDRLAELARHPRVIAWGEIGLDYHYDHPPREVQQRVFREQLELARRARLPVIIHCRDAWADTLAILEREWAGTGLGGIFHCFSGSPAEARRGIDMGFLISFAGNITYPKSTALRDVARELPGERLLIETDSPYLAPQTRRGQRNEPALVLEVAKTLASVRDLSTEEIARLTTANFRRFFSAGRAREPSASHGGSTITVQTAKEIFELIREDLALVEQELAGQGRCAIAPVAEISAYLLEGGGKRLRPAVLLLAAGTAGYRGPGAVRLGAVVELIHTATLMHDDVIDGADTRRGRPSSNARWGNHMSVLSGDWLYMQSFQLALKERNFRTLDVLIDLTQRMVEGELLQWSNLGRIDLTEEDALSLAYRKTACLFSGCARLGAVLAHSDPAIEEFLADYGRCAGLAFQLVDDLLDFTASFQQLGKPVLSDLREGKVTLPLIYALESGSETDRELVACVLTDKGFDRVGPDQIHALVNRTGALDRTRRLACDYAEKARASLDPLPDTDYRRALLSILDFILERDC